MCGLASKAGLIGKSKGKLMVLAMLIHVLAEAEKAVARDTDPGVRFSNIVRKESLDMALRLYELSDQQRLLLMGEREVLHLVWPETFPDPDPNAATGRGSAQKGFDAAAMSVNDLAAQVVLQKFAFEKFIPATIVNRENAYGPRNGVTTGIKRVLEVLEHIATVHGGVLGKLDKKHPPVVLSCKVKKTVSQGVVFVKDYPKTVEAAKKTEAALKTLGCTMAEFCPEACDRLYSNSSM